MPAKLDPDAAAVYRAFQDAGRPAYETLSADEARAYYLAARLVSNPAPRELASVQSIAIPGPAGDIPARLYTPNKLRQDEGLAPALVFFHGGGWVVGDLGECDSVCRFLTKHAGVTVLSVDYRLAPEHVFPAAVEDAVAWWKALLDDGIRPEDTVFAGDSAGGGLALACLIASRDHGLPMPAGAILFSPWTDLSCSGETMQTQAKADVMFNPDSLPEAASFYLDGQPATTPLASPLFGDLHGLPPLMIHASRHEILLADSTRLHDKARQQGVVSELHLRDKLPHVWPTMIMLPEARASLKDCGHFAARVTGSTPVSAS